MAIDLARPWTLNEQVELRPEPFGALAYHFGTRRLSFLKSRKLLAVVRGLAEQPTGSDACRAAGVSEAELPTYASALDTLAQTGMIIERVRHERHRPRPAGRSVRPAPQTLD